MKKTKPAPKTDYLEVHLFEAKPNKMFPVWMTSRLRFLRYSSAVPCACCGRKSKHHWTMFMAFKAAIFGKHLITLESEPTIHPPLTPVCRDHPLEPIMPAKTKKIVRKSG